MIDADSLQRREWHFRVSSVFIKRKWTPTPLDKVDAHIYCFTVKRFTIVLTKLSSSYKNYKTRRISSALCRTIEISNKNEAGNFAR